MAERRGCLHEELGFLLSPPTKPFSGLDHSPEEAETWIIGVPYDSTSSFKPGARFAPARIREVGWELESFNPRLGVDIEELPISDVGDIPLTVEYSTLSNTLARVLPLLYGHGKKGVFIGGTHLISLPIMEYLHQVYPNIGILVFDAHLDLRDEYPQGSKYTHATVMRRLSEMHVPIYYYRPRAFSKEEYSYLAESDNLSTLETPEELEALRGPLYISVDLDIIDPAYAPGVGNPEPLGLSPREVLEALSRVALQGKSEIVGIDVVEANPLVDVNDITSLTAAKILMETLFLISRR